MARETYRDEELQAQFAEIRRELAADRNRRVDDAKTLMQVLLLENPQGVNIVKAYKILQNEGYHEDDIRSAFLDLSHGVVDLTSDRRITLLTNS